MTVLPKATDRLFPAFCRTGDARALGKVFDRTAGELLRVALYLAGNRDGAEDLLQRTFLSAIEPRAAYDPRRRARTAAARAPRCRSPRSTTVPRSSSSCHGSRSGRDRARPDRPGRVDSGRWPPRQAAAAPRPGVDHDHDRPRV